MVYFQIPDMGIKPKMPVLVFLVVYISFVSGQKVPGPTNLLVNILDGEVIVHWETPLDAPSNVHYNVEMAKYSDEWTTVASCTKMTNTYCNLDRFINDYKAAYKVRVQLEAEHKVSTWAGKKFLLNESKLLPPTFTLWATFSTITVSVHPKPILKKIFPFGFVYTIYLEERGEDNKNTTAYLKDDMADDQKTTFTSLHWGREYCVSIKIEASGALPVSNVSKRQCLLLPEQEWFIIAVSSLSAVGVLAFIAIMAMILLCYLRFPEKTPSALKSPVMNWLPLQVEDGTVEVVTDKGWFLSVNRTDMKGVMKDLLTHVTVIEDSEEEERRTSTDSGVSMESNSNSEGNPPMRQEDSGCGSMGGPESTTSSQTDYPLDNERADSIQKREDSGVGMGCQIVPRMHLDGQDSGLLKVAAGGNYRSQSPSDVQMHVSDDEDTFKQIPPDLVLAEVVTGYRAGPQSCICSGAGQCFWCHQQGHNETKVIKQYRAVSIENGLLGPRSDLIDSYKAEKQTGRDTMDDLESNVIPLSDFPLLNFLPPPPLVKCGQDFNMNNVLAPLLCDVELKND